jgi:hypothetical protein
MKVFISYTHDTSDHRDRIAALAHQLRRDGLDVRLDQWVRGMPAEGWPKWMEDEISSAAFILLVCTEAYAARYAGAGDPADGRGARWETSLIRDILYDDGRRITQFVPLLTKNSTLEDIPLPLRHRATHYQLDDYYAILNRLKGESSVELTRRRHTARISDSPTIGFGGAEDGLVARSIRDAYRRIDQRVETLTQEQYKVIEELHGRSRALISGNPGSGKTLVAAEKAIRLADAGVKTLFLCHNPLLADWVREITGSARVDVYDFEDYIDCLAPDPDGAKRAWTEYSQPRSDQIRAALERLQHEEAPYQAVIVDEGQDFADDWWPVVEASTPDGNTSIRYVFFDDQQVLLPYRLNLPAAGWPLSLSRNCRNAGKIYRVMRRLAPNSPLPDQELQELGHVRAFHQPRLRDALHEALAWCAELEALEGLAAVLGGSASFEQSLLANGPFEYGDRVDWWSEVESNLWALAERIPVDENVALALERLALTRRAVPSDTDVAEVSAVANAIQAADPGVGGSKRVRVRVQRAAKGRDPRGFAPSWHWDTMRAYRTGSWVAQVATPKTVDFSPHNRAHDTIPVYSVGEIKGLERQAILLVMQGDAPKFTNQLFVGVSRARAVLAVVADDHTYAALPGRLRMSG